MKLGPASDALLQPQRGETLHRVHRLVGVSGPHHNGPPSAPQPGEPPVKMPPWRAFPVTNTVTVLCMVIFGICLAIGFWPVHGWLHFPELIEPGNRWQLWRLVSPALIHFSWLHIVFNVLWWFLLGRIVEFHHRSRRLIILFFASAIIPNFAQYVVTGVDFGGLSGVVYSLFGYVWVYGHLRPGEGLHVSMTVMVQIVAWLLLGFSGLLDDWVMMANAAHLGGLMVGAFLAFLYASQPSPSGNKGH